MATKVDPEKILRTWAERDLTEAARAGELLPAFEVDDQLKRIADVLASGRQPILCGESGVGKSAIVHELVRRACLGEGAPTSPTSRAAAALAGKRVLQLSLRSRMSALLKPDQMRPEMQKLVEALIAAQDTVVPYFRDLHLAYEFDLEPQLQMLGLRFRGAILGEADGPTFDRMLEGTPGLEQHYVSLGVDEPDLAKTDAIVSQWSESQKARGKEFSPAALRRSVELTHRFLARSRMPRKVIDFLGTVGSLVEAGHVVDESDVLERFYQSYKVPRFLIDPAIPFDVDGTERAFRARVLGQADAVRTVVRMISLIKAGLSDTRRPFGGFLFVGPTGVGKTHIAQLLAEYLFGGKDRMVRINMADHQTPVDASTLFGNPDGYTPRQRRGLLTQRLAGHPFGVLLLDEFEKAHEKVHDRFLQLMDEGAFINGAGETVPCRSLIIIATSNAGAEVYRGQAIGFAGARDLEEMDRELDRLLYKHFRFEFLNRFDQVVHFHPLTRQDIRTIALREIEQLRERAGLKGRDLVLEVDDAILDWLTANGYDPHFGARFLRRTIERTVTTALAEVIVRESLEPETRLALRIRGGRIVATVVERAVETPLAVRVPEGKSEKVVSLDRKDLTREASALAVRAEPHALRLEERKREASTLLSSMNAESFWSDPAEAQRVLDRYRRLDVAIQAEARLWEPLRRLAELCEGGDSRATKTASLARGLELAASALAEWEERLAEDGASSAWLVLRSADPLRPAPEWMEEIAGLYLSWCRRLELAAEVVAFGIAEDALARIAIEVEGPGTSSYLAMEQGIHRVYRTERQDARVRVDVLARTDGTPHIAQRVTSVRRRSGPLGLEASYGGRVDREDLGLSLDFVGANRDVLEALLADVDRHARLLVAPAEIVRVYAQGGTGARDPRTGAVAPRFKDVMRGNLDPFLEGWRRLRRGQVPLAT